MEVRLSARKGRCIQYLDSSGRWKSTGTFNMDEAYVIATARLMAESPCRFDEFAEDMLCNDSAGSWLDINTRMKKLRPSTIESIRMFARSYAIPFFGKMNLSEITAPLIQSWYMTMHLSDGSPASASTRNNALNALSKILGYAEYLGKIDDNPCRLVTKMKKPNSGYPPFTEEETRRMFPNDETLLEEIYDNLNEALFYMIIRDTGMRPGEIAGLSRDDYFPEEHMIFTKSSFDRYTKEMVEEVKTSNKGYANRFGILSEETERILKKELLRIKGNMIFAYDDGKPKGQVHFYNKLRTVLRRLGIEKGERSLYSFRGMFFSRSLSRLPDNVAMVFMGHTSWHSCYDQRSRSEIVKKVRALYDSADIQRAAEPSTDYVISQLRR